MQRKLDYVEWQKTSDKYQSQKHSAQNHNQKAKSTLKLLLFGVIVYALTHATRFYFYEIPLSAELGVGIGTNLAEVLTHPPGILMHQFDLIAKISSYTMGSLGIATFRVLFLLSVIFSVWQRLYSSSILLVLRSFFFLDVCTVVAACVWLHSERAPGLPLPYDEWYCLLLGASLVFLQGKTIVFLKTLRRDNVARNQRVTDQDQPQVKTKASIY